MYGNFIKAVIKFLIVAWVVFLIVKAVNRMKGEKPAEPAAPAGPSEADLLKDILAAAEEVGHLPSATRRPAERSCGPFRRCRCAPLHP